MLTAIDPVCGKELEPGEAERAILYSDYRSGPPSVCTVSNDRQRRRFYFCCFSCKVKFDLAPGFYIGLAAPGQPPHEVPPA